MSNINNESKINGTIDSISIKKTEIILNQMKNCICKIEGKEQGTGFFCKLKYQEKIIQTLITNAHILDKDFIKLNKKVKLSFNEEEIKIINIDESDIIYLSPIEKYDIIILKLNEKSEFDNFLEIDESIFNEHSENIYEKKSIYILHYQKEEKASVSFGFGLTQHEENNSIEYNCYTYSESCGGPILNLTSNKVIGIHKGSFQNKGYNIGTFLKYPLNEMNNELTELNQNIKEIESNTDNNKEKNFVNEIKIEMEINEEDINKNIYFLDNSVFSSYLKELNNENTEIYINEKKYEYKKYFIPEKEGIYKINIKLNIFINDCSHMFYNCHNIISIDLSSFSSKYVTNMSYMFYECYNLKKINFSSFDTKNVANMESMFENCYNLENIDLSSFDTKNVANMMYMFVGCKKLYSLDLSLFGAKNVNNLDLMFYDCLNLKQVKINQDSCEKIIEILKNSNINIIKNNG